MSDFGEIMRSNFQKEKDFGTTVLDPTNTIPPPQNQIPPKKNNCCKN